MSAVELRYAEHLIDIVRKAATAGQAVQGSIIDATVAKFVATTWPELLVDAMFAVEKWKRDDLLKILHHAISHAKDDLALDDGEEVALDMMTIAAGFLHTGALARGGIVRRGDAETRRRLEQAHHALVGKTADAKGIREFVGILKENRQPAFVLRRLHRLDPAFERLDPAWLTALLASYTPGRANKGSGMHSLHKIAALILVKVGVFGVRPRRRDETDADVKARIENVRRRVTSATKRG